MGKVGEQEFTEETQASSQCMKRCHISSVHVELEIETKIYHFTLLGLENVLSLSITRVATHVEKQDLLHTLCWVEQ